MKIMKKLIEVIVLIAYVTGLVWCMNYSCEAAIELAIDILWPDKNKN